MVRVLRLLQGPHAETEKYPHVTYFFNGGEEQAYPGEKCGEYPAHLPDDSTEALSWCCGASGYSYDHDPT